MAFGATRLIFFVLILFPVVTSADTAALIGRIGPPSNGFYRPLYTSPPPPSFLAEILSKLGFRELAAAATNISISGVGSVTFFAPTDSALFSCQSCSLPLLLLEHSLPGLYPLHYLRNFAFGSKITTLAPNRCLTITSTTAVSTAFPTKTVFVNGAELTKPDLFNNGRVIVHGLQGFVSHLSHLSCQIERHTTLEFLPQPSPAAAVMFATRLMLKEAMMRLRATGYSILALAMRVKYPELSELKTMTIFGLDDASIFAGGGRHPYVADLGFHIVPDKLLRGSELITLPPETVLPSMEQGRNLVVTTAATGSRFTPLRINYVKIRSFDVVYTSRVAVHGLSEPFPRLPQDQTAGDNFSLIDGQDYVHV